MSYAQLRHGLSYYNHMMYRGTATYVRTLIPCLKVARLIRFAAFVAGSPKGDLGHLGDLLPKIGLLKVTFLLKSLLSKRKDKEERFHI